jgi:type II secretory pathway predicted ATPase ExeA
MSAAFGPTANPEAYVPWSGSERALDALLTWAEGAGAPICLLAGPPGMGKTLLLKLLAKRADPVLRALYIAYPQCDRAALYGFVLHGLGRDADDAGPGALLEALRDDARPVLLLVDEGELLPVDTVQGLHEIATSAAGRLRVAIAVTREDPLAELAKSLGDAAALVRIEGAMSRAEVAAHVRSQLARADVDPRLGAFFDAAAVARLHASSEGIPASLQSQAAALLFETQRARGELRPPRLGAPPAPVEDDDDGPVTIELAPVPRAPDLALAPEPAPVRRAPSFVLGAAVGVAAGLAAAAIALHLRGAPAPTAAEVAPPTPPPVASAPPSEAAPAPAVSAPAPAAAPAAAAGPPVTVSFNSDPWAYIEVDGRPIGVTPIAAHMVTPGRHRVVASLQDGRVIDRQIQIDAERNRRIVFP